tara:strand:+ start:671 stop:1168 length:498 start_codon:yes stop_codon:yes gene_type:complete
MRTHIRTLTVLGFGLLGCGHAAALSGDDPLQGQVWEVVISSDAAVYHEDFTIELRFDGNCIAMSSADADLDFEDCGSQFALTEADENGYTYAFSYDFPYAYIFAVQAGFSSNTIHETGHAQGDADCAGFDLMEVGETRSELCGLPELTVEQDYAHPRYSSITRMQ